MNARTSKRSLAPISIALAVILTIEAISVPGSTLATDPTPTPAEEVPPTPAASPSASPPPVPSASPAPTPVPLATESEPEPSPAAEPSPAESEDRVESAEFTEAAAGPEPEPLTLDTWDRPNQSGWGTASSGFVWTHDHLFTGSGSASIPNNAGRLFTSGGGQIFSEHRGLIVSDQVIWPRDHGQMRFRFRMSSVTGGFRGVIWLFGPAANPNRNAGMIQVEWGRHWQGTDPPITVEIGDGLSPPVAATTYSFAANEWVSGVLEWEPTQVRLRLWKDTIESEPSTWLLIGNVDPAFTFLPKQIGGDIPNQIDNSMQVNLGTNTSTGRSMDTDWIHFAPPGPPVGTEHNGHPNGAVGGDPVHTFTGSLTDTHRDLAIPGRGPAIAFQRTYNSNDSRIGPLGPGWTHSYAMRLVDAADGTDDLYLIGPQGRSDRYVRNGDGTYTAPPAIHTHLAANPDGTFTATHKDQSKWAFDEAGRLTALADRFGNLSTLAYDGSGNLASISDPAGRGSLTLGYTDGRLTSATDWAVPARVVTYQYDADGRLWKVTDREGQTTTYTYDAGSHRLATVTDRSGNVALTSTYDAQGRVATQKDARGLTTGDVTTYAYVVNPDGTRETTITAPATSFEPSFTPSLTDSYDANGWLVQRVTRPSSTETLTQSFTYDVVGNRTSATDARGNRTDFCYDVDYAGSPISGGAADLTRRIDPAPAMGADRPVTLIAYDAKHNVVQTVAPRGVPSGATVTCGTDLSAVTSSFAVDFAYDAAGAALLASSARFTDPDLGLQTAVTKYEYGDAANPGLVTRIIPPRGNAGPSPDYTYATTFTYGTGASAGLLKDLTDPLGNRTSFAYDAVGRLTSTVDPLGNATGGVPAEHTTTLSYDKEDRLRFRISPAPGAGGAGLIDETRYDAAGNPIVHIDANGQVSTFDYDERNSLATVTESAQAWTDPASPPNAVIVTSYTHDAGANVSRITSATGDSQHERVTDYAYDGRGLLRRETQYPSWPSTTGPLITTSTYDPNGNRLALGDPLGRTTTFAHDALNRLANIDYSDPATADVSYTYDANGSRTTMADGTGATSYAVDEAGRLTSVTGPGSVSVGYRYDVDGNRTKLIYPDATAVSYAWNEGGQLASLADWASRSVGYAYAPDGLLQTATNPDGSVATYAYDNARRLVDILHTRSGGAPLDRFAYTLDAAGNVTAVVNGSLASQYARPDGLIASNGAWTGTFASINESPASDATFLASPSGPTSANIYEVSLANVEPPHTGTGIVVRYRYAKSGNNSGKNTHLTVQLRQGSTVIASKAHTNIPGASGSGWQAGSFTLTTAQANAITDFADLRLRLVPSSTGGGQPRKVQVSWAEVEFPSVGNPATHVTYSYDRLNRLTSAQDTSGVTSYTYDPVGNRLTAGAAAFTYDRADRILNAGATPIAVDANGNLTAKGSDTFTFDQANRLTSATVAGAAESYQYDGDGTRFSRQVGTDPAIQQVSDVSGGLPVTIDDGTRKYVYGAGLAYAVSGSSIEIYHADRLGSVRALTDGAGSVTATYRTDAWGSPTESSGISSQPFGFTGEPRDATGLTYLRARYYDPALGRFMSRDVWAGSMASSQSLNRYAYATNNPVRYTDPSGHCGVDLVADVLFSGYSLGQVIFGPDKERGENVGYLLLDVGGIFIPCGAGLGTVSRALRVAGNAADAGFDSFSAFKRSMGAAGPGMEWHHIVGQTPGNVAQFGGQALHNTGNVVAVAADVHRKISAYYSTKQSFTGGLTVRDWLGSQTFEQQQAFGQAILQRFGGSP